MSDFGVKIAKEDKNVLEVADNDLVFSSTFQTLPVYKIIKKEYAITSLSSVRYFVKHGLPFVPTYLIFYKASKYSDRWQMYPSSGFDELSPAGQNVTLDRADKENISFVADEASGSNAILTVVIIIFTLPIALSL